jgi:hypothetical protein
MNLSFPCLKRDMDRVKMLWIHRNKIYEQSNLDRFVSVEGGRGSGS